MPRAGAGDAPVVFNPQDQDAALAIGEADDRLDEVSVIQSLGFLALELDRIAFARPYELTKFVGIHAPSLCKDMQSCDPDGPARITYANERDRLSQRSADEGPPSWACTGTDGSIHQPSGLVNQRQDTAADETPRYSKRSRCWDRLPGRQTSPRLPP